jgi:hypothetical protein
MVPETCPHLTLSFCDIHTLSSSPPLHTFSLYLKFIETETIMDHFETQNLIFFYLVCLTSLKSNIIFLILFEIFFLTFYVDLRFVTLSFCDCFIILSFLVTGCIFSESKLQSLGLLLILFVYFFLLYSLTWVTTLDPNAPKPAHCPPLIGTIQLGYGSSS